MYLIVNAIYIQVPHHLSQAKAFEGRVVVRAYYKIHDDIS